MPQSINRPVFEATSRFTNGFKQPICSALAEMGLAPINFARAFGLHRQDGIVCQPSYCRKAEPEHIAPEGLLAVARRLSCDKDKATSEAKLNKFAKAKPTKPSK